MVGAGSCIEAPAEGHPVGIATVTLIGDDPSAARAYLLLGAVVILSPDIATLERWWVEVGTVATPPRRLRLVEPPQGLHIDHIAHCIRWEGQELPLTELEFRVLASLAADPGQARSYRELRRAGWGNVPDLGDDSFVVRAVVQRMRRKLSRVGAEIVISPVRGFGLRLDHVGAG